MARTIALCRTLTVAEAQRAPCGDVPSTLQTPHKATNIRYCNCMYGALWLRSIGVIQSARTTPKLLSRLMADCTRHECCPPVLIESSFRTLSELVVHSNGVGSAKNVEVI